MKTIAIKNVYLDFTINTLFKLQLEEKEASARRRFLKILKPLQETLDAYKQELRLKLCEKNEKGDLKIQNGEYIFKNIAIRQSFLQEWEKLNEEPFAIAVNEYNSKDIAMVKKILQNEVDSYKVAHKKLNADEYDYLASIEEVIEFLKI